MAFLLRVNETNNGPSVKDLREKVDSLDSRVKEGALFIGGLIPTIRRVQSVPDKLEQKNYEGAALQTAIAAANFPGDLTQLVLAGRELNDIATNGFSALSKREFQREFSFLRGTFLQGKLPWLEQFDDTLFNTSFGEKVLKTFKITLNPEENFALVKGVNSTAIPAVKFPGNAVQNVVGRSLLRISRLGLFASAIMEAPAIIRSWTDTQGSVIDKTKALGKQLLKSAGYVGIINTAIAVAGAIAFPYGIVVELGAMAIGSAVGLVASKALNSGIDNIFKDENETAQKLETVIPSYA